MSGLSARILAPDDIARATVELILALQKEFPKVRLVPCDSVEGEAIHLEAYLPVKSASELAAAQGRAIELKHAIEDRYGIYVLVRVLSEAPSTRSSSGP